MSLSEADTRAKLIARIHIATYQTFRVDTAHRVHVLDYLLHRGLLHASDHQPTQPVGCGNPNRGRDRWTANRWPEWTRCNVEYA